MFLKTLTLKGFKSFAETTSLEMEPGVTVVVGPNGSGKSNVVDAIGWVLGAQAPSAVRSQKMDDVIFAGTAKRPALGRAEVSLTIDNTAHLLPIDFTEVTISRTLFRNGESEYAINGVPCRLLDIQELLSDTGVGRQQHVIVSQGQIDAVLNARPEERRLIIEEAAGVLKFRRRKEKAERRLAATEGNLTRVQDLLREVRRQLRPLERQAEAARRHGDLVGELAALRLHLAGRDIATLRSRLATTTARKAELVADESALKSNLAQLDSAVIATEAQLSAMGGHDVSDALVRFESLRERARGIAAVLAERRRNLERERTATVDQAVIATLEAEAARLTDELGQVDAEAVALAPEVDALAGAQAELVDERAAFETDWADGVVPPSSRAAEVRGELAALRAGIERGGGELARMRQRLDLLEQKASRLQGEAARLRADLIEAEAVETGLAATFAEAEVALAAATEAARARRRMRDGRRMPTGIRGRRAPTRSPRHSTPLGRVRAPSGSRAWKVSWARCSTSSRSTTATKRPSKRLRARRWQRSSSTTSTRRVMPSTCCTAATLPEPFCRSVQSAGRRRFPSGTGSRSGGTCVRMTAGSRACSTPCSARSSSSTATGQPLSISRSLTPALSS